MAAATPVLESGPGFIEEIDSNELDLQTPVGKGSFGVVYKAIWRGISVAVKTIESESERIAFVTELRQLSRVSHPNIVCLYGACRNPVSLVMELAECGSLYTLLHGPGPQPHYTSGHGMSWCLQCANGVAYLHGMKPKALIHRDLKPPNLLLTNNGVVLKICDFGTACDQHTHMTNNKGSAAWMAPEVFEGSQYSEKCDVFSWGIILWEVLTRRKPFDDLGGPAFRIMWAVHTGARPNLIQGCPKPVEDLMTSCWSPKPHQRPSMDEVVDAMNDLLNFFPGEATPLSFPSRDIDNNSDVSSNYEVSITDSVIESHMGTISGTVRKPHVKAFHPSTGPHVKPLVGSTSASPLSQRSQDLVSESRVRSRSHTPDPHRAHHDLTRRAVRGHRRSSSYGNKLEIPYDALRDGAGVGGRRRSSADDLIADLEKEPIVKTPIGSPSSSPIMGRMISHRGRNSPMPDPGPSTSSPAHNTRVALQYVPMINPTPVPADLKPQSQYLSSGEVISSDSDSQCDSFPRAYVTLELHLQPLPPSTSSKESMEIYQQHCVLAEEYLKVSTEIALLKQRGEQLRNELEQDEKAKLEGNRLMLEYQQLVAENTSLQKWYDKMRKDLARVRESRQNQIWT